MAQESLAEKRYWILKQLDGAVVFIVLSTAVVALRCAFVAFWNKKKKQEKSVGWEGALLLASLIAFLPLCVCAISEYPSAFPNISSTAHKS